MRDHFGFFAPFYDRLFGPPDPAHLLDFLQLPAAGRMLDVGGGTGRVSCQLRPYVDVLHLNDFSLKMLQQAQTKGLCCPSASQAEKLPFPDNCFERVLVVDALHHFFDQKAAIGELARVLKPGGRLVIEEPDRQHFVVKMVALVEKALLMDSHFHYPQEIQDMVSAHGLDVSLERDGRFAAWVIADKNDAVYEA